MHKTEISTAVSRRDFFKASAAAGSLSIAASAHAAGSDVIRVGLIGSGTRGPAAAMNAMNTDKGVRLVAIADMRLDRIQETRTALKVKYPDQVAVDDDHCFTGFDAYKQVTWDQISGSNYCHLPKPEDVRAGVEPPVRPGADGIYPLPFTPGVSKVL